MHATVTFPSGRPTSRVERLAVGAGYDVNFWLNLPYLLVGPSLAVVGVRERNVFLVTAHVDAARWIGETTQWLTFGWATLVVGLVGAKAWAASDGGTAGLRSGLGGRDGAERQRHPHHQRSGGSGRTASLTRS